MSVWRSWKSIPRTPALACKQLIDLLRTSAGVLGIDFHERQTDTADVRPRRETAHQVHLDTTAQGLA